MQMCADLAINTERNRTTDSLFHLFMLFSLLAGLCGCTEHPATSGHLTHVRGQLLDSGGRPVTQYPMKLEPLDGSSRPFSAVTDYSGNFEFADVPTGAYRVYPANRDRSLGQTIRVQGQPTEFVGKVEFGGSTTVELNAAAAPVINDQAKQTINPEAARTINAEAARTINADAARTINPAAARTINSEAARYINPDAARVLNPERAKILTRQEAQALTVQQAREPVK
jgi:hypothetical protein